MPSDPPKSRIFAPLTGRRSRPRSAAKVTAGEKPGDDAKPATAPLERFSRLRERKYAIDHGPGPVQRHRIGHRLQILDRTDRDALQPLLLHHHQRNAQILRRRAGEHADEGDGAADLRRAAHAQWRAGYK